MGAPALWPTLWGEERAGHSGLCSCCYHVQAARLWSSPVLQSRPLGETSFLSWEGVFRVMEGLSSKPAVCTLFWHQGQVFHGEEGDGSGSNSSDGERCPVGNGAVPACPRRTFCTARFPTVCRPVGLGAPALNLWIPSELCSQWYLLSSLNMPPPRLRGRVGIGGPPDS